METIPVWVRASVSVLVVLLGLTGAVLGLLLSTYNHRLERIETDDAALRAVVEGVVPNVAGLVVRAEQAAENCARTQTLVQQNTRDILDLRTNPTARKDSFTGSDGKELRLEFRADVIALTRRVDLIDARLDTLVERVGVSKKRD